MKFFIILAVVAVSLNSFTSAEKIKARRSSVYNLPADADDDSDLESTVAEFRQAAASGDSPIPTEILKPDSSKGRMFLKKFLLFSNMWGGNKNTQPIIPIIITGAGNAASNTQTVTTTTTGTMTATGDITTTPTARAGEGEGDDYLIGEEDVMEDHMPNGKANGSKQQVIKLKSGKVNEQSLQFVVPQKYMRYFQNNPNLFLANPNAFNNNNGFNKIRKNPLNNNGNVKRKRSKSPMRRFTQHQ